MPEISRFYGIVIYMYWNEHAPPHFHAKYGEYEASISIENFGIDEGYLPGKAMALVVEWALANKKELMSNWETLRTTGKFIKIDPIQ